MGCHKCLKKAKDGWFCLDCKNAKEGQTPKENSDIFSMFG
jgi:hypothetical protein